MKKMSINKAKRLLSKPFKWYVGLYRGKKWYRKLAAGFVSFIVAVILLLGAVDINFLGLFGKSPGFSDISHPVVSEASIIYSDDGKQIGKFFSENRTPVEFEEISPVIVNALIDTEDERFYQHFGIDFQGLFAAVKDMARGRARGASTITQQLAKNLFRTRTEYSTGLLGKVPVVKLGIIKAKEWIVALKLEYRFKKEDILTMYFNTVDFGSNAFGIKTACKTYFDTTPDKLTYEQACTLVGLLKATSTYNPKLNPKNSTERRNVVLDNMFAKGHIKIDGKVATQAQLDSIKAIPMEVSRAAQESNYDGIAPYFRNALVEYINRLYEEGKLNCEGGKPDLYAAGWKIYTTLDTRMQKYAEEAAREQMKVVQRNFDNHWGNTNPWQDEQHHEIPNFIENLAKKTEHYKWLQQKYGDNNDSIQYYLNQPHTVKLFSYDGPIKREMSTMDSIRYMVHFMHCSMIAIEPDTRYVRAWVGDIDFDSWKYDKVTAMRQPGSTFKLFVYTEAMNQGLVPSDRREDSYIGMKVHDPKTGEEKMWAPHNANGYFTGANMYLKSAFAQSVNSVAVKLGQEIGIPNVINTAHNMGIESPLDNVPSLALGASDVELAELVNAYCCVADDGYAEPYRMITRIEDRDGNVIYEAPKDKSDKKVAIPYRSAFFMQEMLKGGLTEPGGTSQSLRRYVGNWTKTTDFGGKTGTSNAHSDAWFVGVSPKLVVGAWVGGEYRCIHFRTGQLGQGSRTALPICGFFYEKVLNDPTFSKKYQGKFAPAPEDIPASAYKCVGEYIQRADSTELDGDSLSLVNEGNEVPVEATEPSPATEETVEE
jgi:penicillin-binding protein 1A